MLTTFCQFIYIWHLHLFSWWTTRLPLYNCFRMNFLVLFIFSHKVWGSTNKYYCAAVGSTDHLCDWIWIVFVLDLVPQPISYFPCVGRYRNWKSDACCATYYLKSNHVWGELWYGAWNLKGLKRSIRHGVCFRLLQCRGLKLKKGWKEASDMVSVSGFCNVPDSNRNGLLEQIILLSFKKNKKLCY